MIYFYGKLGGALSFDWEKDKSLLAARWEPIMLLDRLLEAAGPNDRFVLIQKHNEIPQEYRDRGVVSAFEITGTTDAHEMKTKILDYVWPNEIILWVGVTAVSTPIPAIGRDYILKPRQSDWYMCAPIVHIVNQWQDADPYRNQPRFLHPDMRYPLKCRDLKWPLLTPILSQITQDRVLKCYDYGDPRVASMPNTEVTDDTGVFRTTQQYVYSGLETICGMSDVSFSYAPRRGGIVIANEIKRADARYALVSHLESYHPDIKIIGDWETKEHRGVHRNELPHLLNRAKYGIVPTLVGGKNGAATPKFWEYVCNGVIPIAAPGYDVQGHLPWLPGTRAEDYKDLTRIIRDIEADDGDYSEWFDDVIAEGWDRSAAFVSDLLAPR